ncbi:hypothetical protein [Hallella seregens]|uniref:Uncharacterized protein n=1 Tax=Hallella seregens ATCC 51272 TaxID=1336250 RepID=A0ABV5ZKC5_9BACT|nr:hypothetical protein [Hallella seregens]
MIQIGDKFNVRWVGHDECYKGRLYQVTSFLEDCTCGKPAVITGKPEEPRRPHLHVRAKLIEAPAKYMIGECGFVFGALDSETLHDIEDSDEFWIEIVRQKGDQLNLFSKY